MKLQYSFASEDHRTHTLEFTDESEMRVAAHRLRQAGAVTLMHTPPYPPRRLGLESFSSAASAERYFDSHWSTRPQGDCSFIYAVAGGLEGPVLHRGIYRPAQRRIVLAGRVE